MQAQPSMLARTVQRDLTLVQDGKCTATILYPGGELAYARLAERLAESIGRYAENRPRLVRDSEAIPSNYAVLGEEYHRQPLILLGSLNTNRVITPLYARYDCATDALYPGGNGFDLRTLVNPFGAGANALLVGGSTLGGVERAGERLLTHIESAGQPGALKLPFIMDVELEPALAKMLADWPDAQLDAPLPTTADLPIFRAIGAYAVAYTWTGDVRYGLYARDCLRKLNELVGDSYGDRHYYVERLVRAILMLSAGGFLDEADLLRTDQLLLNMMLGQQGMWWRKRDAAPPLGHRHHGKGSYEFLLTAQYLRWQAQPDEAARELSDRWIQESQAYLDGLARAGFDDQDDDTTSNNMATLFWYALGEERYEFFENGNARRLAERAIALHDNMGAAAGQSGYSESYLHMMYMQQEATIPVAATAFFFQDKHMKWILKKIPNLDVPIAGGRYLYYYPIFMHKFDTGEELSAELPLELTRLRVQSLAPYQFMLNNDPPLHVEPLGHFTNAPETWQLPEGVGKNNLGYEKGFDKIVFRSGYEKDGVYLLLQGYQGGFRWQGRNRAANCIVRFSQFGHIFLIQNTRRLSPYDANGIYASDGYNLAPVPPIVERLAAAEFSQVAVSATRLSNYHTSDWTRTIFWHKAGLSFFVVLDSLSPQKGGEYSYTCTWRTPGYAALAGQDWIADQGQHRFTLRSSETLESFTEIESSQNAAAPYVLRQVKSGQFQEKAPVTFQNLFYVRPIDAHERLAIKKISARQVLVTRDGIGPVGLCAVGGEDPISAFGFRAVAHAAWISATEIDLSGAAKFSIDAGVRWEIESDPPVGISLDLTNARLAILPDSISRAITQVKIKAGGETTTLVIQKDERYSGSLEKSLCEWLARMVGDGLEGLLKQEIPVALPDAKPEVSTGLWKTSGPFDLWTPIQERLRNLTVVANPAPLDGFPEQLIDTVYPETRDLRQQWPDASEYQITLTLPEEKALSDLRLVGDSFSEPFFKLFSPLPQGIKIELSHAATGVEWTLSQVPAAAGRAIQQRFRGNEDRFECRVYPINERARRVRLTVPPPSPGRMLALNEIEVFSTAQDRPEIKFLAPADLDHSGQAQIVACNANQELLILNNDGSERWRKQLPSPVTHLSCHDLDGDGRQQVCVGLLNGDIQIYDANGDLRQTLHLAAEIAQRTDAFFGWLDAAIEIQVWQRTETGRAALMVGGYGMVIFLDPEGKILGHSWADGPWVYNLLALQGRRGNDIWARTGWNHGIMVYESAPGFKPGGESIEFGNVRQPMFRSASRVIPFVNGRSILFEAYPAHESRGEKVVVAAAEDGVGVLAAGQRDWLWKIEGGTPITACLVGEVDESPREESPGEESPGEGSPGEGSPGKGKKAAVITGGADGFIAAYGMYNGKPLRKWYAGAPITGLSWLKAGGILVVGTHQGLMALNSAWERQSFQPAEVFRMIRVNDQTICVSGKKGLLTIISL